MAALAGSYGQIAARCSLQGGPCQKPNLRCLHQSLVDGRDQTYLLPKFPRRAFWLSLSNRGGRLTIHSHEVNVVAVYGNLHTGKASEYWCYLLPRMAVASFT